MHIEPKTLHFSKPVSPPPGRADLSPYTCKRCQEHDHVYSQDYRHGTRARQRFVEASLDQSKGFTDAYTVMGNTMKEIRVAAGAAMGEKLVMTVPNGTVITSVSLIAAPAAFDHTIFRPSACSHVTTYRRWD